MLIRFFETGVFLPTLNVAIVLSIAIAIFCRELRFRRIVEVLILTCLFLILYTTVLGRISHDSYNVCLMPFWSVGAIKDGLIEVLYEKIYNVLFFIPYGLLIGLWFKVYGLWNSMKKSMAVGFLTSVGIELLQLITRTGTCETDDVICNTIGCAVGAMVAIGCIRLFKWFKWFKRYDK